MFTKIDSNSKRIHRKKRVRAKIFGTSNRPRLAVYRSNKHVYAQLIDDENHKTIVSLSDSKIKMPTNVDVPIENIETFPKVKAAYILGTKIGKLAKKAKVSQVVFDRAGYKYHGRIKAVAEGARASGLEF